MRIGWIIIALPLVAFTGSFLFKGGTGNAPEFSDEYIADHFDFPVGKPDAEGYYNAQSFGENNHLGDDWNANTGGNSDLGQPVYSVANGYVTFAKDIRGGWGNVVRVLHRLPDDTYIESLYAHCDTVLVSTGAWVRRGDKIGTIGNAHGLYWAHLHFELRTNTTMGIGGGYSAKQDGYVDPTAFIQQHR